MKQALALAEQAAEKGEVPVGAVVVANDEVIGRGFNCPIGTSDPTAHAEIIALRDAATNINNYRLAGCDLYVTIEPCTMCVGAMIHARINRIIFGAHEPRAGALTSQLALLESDHFNHSMEWTGGILEDECRGLIKEFFKQRR